jgi:catalase (peroxidase I)
MIPIFEITSALGGRECSVPDRKGGSIMSEESKCPVTGRTGKAAGRGTSNRDWWPNQLNLHILHQHSSKSNPLGKDFNYLRGSQKLDLLQ